MNNNENKIEHVKVAWAICQLDLQTVIHKSSDVMKDNIQPVLNGYGIYQIWTKKEIEFLRKHLLEMANKEKYHETVRWKNQLSDSLDSKITFPNEQGEFRSISEYESSASNQGSYVRTEKNDNMIRYRRLELNPLNLHTVRSKRKYLRPVATAYYIDVLRR